MSVEDVVREVVSGAIGYEAGLDALTVAPAGEVDAALTGALRDAFDRLFRGGWQPAELHRVIARLGDPLKADMVAAAAAGYAGRFSPVDPRWADQASSLPAAPARRPDRISLLDSSLGLLTELRRLPSIDVLIPPPGAAPDLSHKSDNRVLDRVRALLAKAESTDFPAEAEAYSAKAQELIARHSIEEALTTAGRAEVVPFARRIGVDHPYESEKAALLDAVARANHCHTVWSPELGFSTIFGYDTDIDGVELLYTSLLVQANRAMARDEPAKGKARIKAFRRSFLVAYAVRIGERLTETIRHEIAQHSDLLPVLRNREIQVREVMQKAFPRTVRARGSRIDSLEGWESGRAAADEAELR
ncbi:DUF2786 domain-containing protein [Actinoplanes sp. NPDC049596]|uniref:DUF2786 domain-containing protein n=1 Tax=unclassified Actinoplanes TaxID=2626549 RepID=UPI003418995A